jgi:hypothetical protein
MQDVRLDLADHIIEPSAEIADDPQLAKPGQLGGNAGRHWRPEELPLSDPLTRRPRRIMLAARQQQRLPPHCALLVDNTESAIDIAALQRQRMVEYVQDPHCPKRLCGDHSALYQERLLIEFPLEWLSYC